MVASWLAIPAGRAQDISGWPEDGTGDGPGAGGPKPRLPYALGAGCGAALTTVAGGPSARGRRTGGGLGLDTASLVSEVAADCAGGALTTLASHENHGV